MADARDRARKWLDLHPSAVDNHEAGFLLDAVLREAQPATPVGALDVEAIVRRERNRILAVLPPDSLTEWWNPLNGPSVRVRAIVNGDNDGTRLAAASDARLRGGA